MLLQELALGLGWVMEQESKQGLKGYLLMRAEENLMDITRLGVRPEFQRRGVGRMLLRCVIGLYNLDAILTVRKNNESALRLYAAFGFRIVGEVQDRSWLMRRVIQSELRG